MEWNCVEGLQESGVAGVRSLMFCKLYPSQFDAENNFEGSTNRRSPVERWSRENCFHWDSSASRNAIFCRPFKADRLEI
jgi:hypothetical protein